MLRLQRSLGNQAVSRLVAPLGLAAAGSKEEARGLWGVFNDRYPPSLTYAKDAGLEFQEDVEMEEQRLEEDEPYEEDLTKIPAADMALVGKNPLTPTRFRSGKK